MGAVHFSLGMCIIYKKNFEAVMLIITFIFFFQLSEGPILWIYSAEVCNDAAFGFAVFGQLFNLICIAAVTEYMIEGLEP